MKVFLSHTSTDKDIVLPIAGFLKGRGLDVWIDAWSMSAGDSLIEKIGEGVETSDRLVAFLSPRSVESAWVKKELAVGAIMELAEEKGLGQKFVIPALLESCKVPFFLKDKLYANFTNKSFTAGCEELFRGITDAGTGRESPSFDTRIVREYRHVRPTGQHVLLVEFGSKLSPIEGAYVGIETAQAFQSGTFWFDKPNNSASTHTDIPCLGAGDIVPRPTLYICKAQSPKVTTTMSLYVELVSDVPLHIVGMEFLDVHKNEPA